MFNLHLAMTSDLFSVGLCACHLGFISSRIFYKCHFPPYTSKHISEGTATWSRSITSTAEESFQPWHGQPERPRTVCCQEKLQKKTTPVTVHLDHSLVFMWDTVGSLESWSCIGDVIKGNRNLRGVETINATKLLIAHVKPASRRRTAGARLSYRCMLKAIKWNSLPKA